MDVLGSQIVPGCELQIMNIDTNIMISLRILVYFCEYSDFSFLFF